MFCPACEEEAPSPHQDGICLTCGEELISSPGDDPNRRSRPRARDDNAAAAAAAVLLSVAGNEGGSDLVGALPPEALDPQAGAARVRTTSRAVLDGLARVVLTAQSAELFDAQVRLFEPRPIDDPSPRESASRLTLNAVPGEFGPMASRGGRTGDRDRRTATPTPALVVWSPRTTKGGTSDRTLSEIALLRRRRVPFVAYVERGDGITFAQKALACQRAGDAPREIPRRPESLHEKSESLCVGVIVGNAASGRAEEVWPYVMQDTKREAQRFGLRVPVVMVRREDGARLVRWAREGNATQCTPCQISVRSKEADSRACPICTDSYVPGATIVRLPLCGHVFHESCALAWLTKRNTCPYCRKEMPTDDEDYERERRRREALGSTSGAGAVDTGRHDFYG